MLLPKLVRARTLLVLFPALFPGAGPVPGPRDEAGEIRAVECITFLEKQHKVPTVCQVLHEVFSQMWFKLNLATMLCGMF